LRTDAVDVGDRVDAGDFVGDVKDGGDDGGGADAGDAETAVLAARFAHRVLFFVRRIERRFGLAEAWHDDLVSAGYWGLFKAVENRRPGAHERELSAYVSQRIEGAVFDEARRLLGRRELPLELDETEIEQTWGEACASWPSLDRESGEDPETRADRIGRWRLVERSLDALSEEERRLLMAYASGRSVAELARDDQMAPGRLQSRLDRSIRLVRARSPELRRLLRYEL
jgi:RNA polymerase sigma factor (sigma-70 family)